MPKNFKAKDPISALTHLIGMILSILFMPVLLIKAARFHMNLPSLISLVIFMLSMIFLYGASTSYHAFNLPGKGNRILKKLDHSMISVLIAGSYTPICIIGLSGQSSRKLLLVIWLFALSGIVFKLFWVTCPRYISSILYIVMGWVCLAVLPELYRNVPLLSFVMLFTGGLFYSAGGVIYSMDFRPFKKFSKNFSSHDLFHIFVMLGSLCHFICMYAMVN